jgi:MFS-type transporter involved in bile tolerance (Atg22 family)
MTFLSINYVRAVLGGITHLALVGGIYLYKSGTDISSTVDVGTLAGIAFTLNGILGGFLIGAIPVYVSSRYRLGSPIVVMILIAVGVVIITPYDPNAAGPSDLAFYFVFWIVPVVVTLISGGVEVLVRRARRSYFTKNDTDLN